MVNGGYVPAQGDIVWLDFNPQQGHEQRGRRPALVISHKEYNETVGLALFCPITSRVKGYPFEVELNDSKVNGVVLSDQLKSLDWQARSVEFIEKSGADIFAEVKSKLLLLID
ncbi:MAG: endoribonuclease MazF [Spirochaetota bacterium]